MTSIGNQISFNNTPYNVDRSNSGQNQTAVRENFAQKLNEFSQDNNISADEKAQLETLSSTGTAGERAIVATFSKAGTAAFDPDAAAPMPPVQLSFGTPGSAPAQATQTPAPVTATTQNPPADASIRVRVGGEYGLDGTVSRSMASFLDSATRSNNDINPGEFSTLGEISASTRTPGDAQVVDELRNLATAQTSNSDARTPIVIGSDTRPRQVRLNNTPEPEGRAGAGGGGIGDRLMSAAGDTLGLIIERAPNAIATAGINLLTDAITPDSNPASTTSTTGKPTTTPTTPDVPVTKDKL